MLAAKLSAAFPRMLAQFRRWLPIVNFEPRDYHFSQKDIAKFHQVTSDAKTTTIDDTTWKDMLIEEYLTLLSVETSIFGRQMLYRYLRAGLSDPDSNNMEQRLDMLMSDPKQLDELHQICSSLRNSEMEIAGLLFEEERPIEPRWASYIWQLPFVFIGLIIGAFWFPQTLLLTGLLMYLLISMQIRYSDLLQVWSDKINSLQMLLRTISLLGKREHPLLARLIGKHLQAGKLNRRLTRSPILNMLPGSRDYSDWFMLGNIKHYFKTIAIVFEHREFLRQCYLDIANIEADIALARHLLQTPVWCRVVRGPDSELMLEQALHPLLSDAVPLSIELRHKGAFISGQNGIGKSTLLRTIGLNQLAGRAFGFCYARRASLSMLPIFSSMQSEDSLLTKESLYMAELRRARELLAVTEEEHGAIFIIDEIFRGTNHLESVSAASAVLDSLSEKGMVIVSSHNLILGALLQHRLTPFCVKLSEDNGQRILSPGVLETTNGIALLTSQGFDPLISTKASRVFEWLDAYLAHPSNCGDVLNPS